LNGDCKERLTEENSSKSLLGHLQFASHIWRATQALSCEKLGL
jgi:hypothetical protein